MGKQTLGVVEWVNQEGTNSLAGNRGRAHWKGRKGSGVGDGMSWASSTPPPAPGTRLCALGQQVTHRAPQGGEMLTAPQGWERQEANGAEGWDGPGTGGLQHPQEQGAALPRKGPQSGSWGGTGTAPLWEDLSTHVGAPGVRGT